MTSTMPNEEKPTKEQFEDYEYDHCDGCNMYTSYLMGRADALQEAIDKQKSVIDE